MYGVKRVWMIDEAVKKERHPLKFVYFLIFSFFGRVWEWWDDRKLKKRLDECSELF